MKKHIRLLASTGSAEVGASIQAALKKNPTVSLSLHTEPLSALLPCLEQYNILLVDLDPSDEHALLELAAVMQHANDIGVLVTAAHSTIDGVRQLMRMGVADFVPQPITEQDLQAALSVAVSKAGSNPRESSGQVVSFLGAGGGVGTTTVALETAITLRTVRRKEPPPRVALLDFDLQFGNVGLSLNLPPSPGILSLVESGDRIDAELLQRAMAAHPASGIHVLTAPPRIVSYDVIIPDFVGLVLALATQVYDHVIVDLPPGWLAWTPKVLACSDRIVLVGDLSVTGIYRTRQQLALIADQDLRHVPLILVMNRVVDGWFSGNRVRLKQAEAVLKRKVDVLIYEDQATAGAARDRGLPISAMKSNTKMTKQIISLSQVVSCPALIPQMA